MARIKGLLVATTVASDNFDACLAITFAQEGGFANDPQDRGGPTKFGITLATLRAYSGRSDLGEDDVRELTQAQARRSCGSDTGKRSAARGCPAAST